MDTQEQKPPMPVIFVMGFLFLIMLSAFIPSNWLGVKPAPKKILDLGAITTITEVVKDTNKDGTVSWNEVINQTLNDPKAVDITKDTPVDEKVIAQLNDPNNLTAFLQLI
jgi:hypothetical protein